MASPRSIPARSLSSSDRRYRRSSFNGARQLKAAQAPARRVLALLAVLALALVAALAVIIGTHLQSASEQLPGTAADAAVTRPANR